MNLVKNLPVCGTPEILGSATGTLSYMPEILAAGTVEQQSERSYSDVAYAIRPEETHKNPYPISPFRKAKLISESDGHNWFLILGSSYLLYRNNRSFKTQYGENLVRYVHPNRFLVEFQEVYHVRYFNLEDEHFYDVRFVSPPVIESFSSYEEARTYIPNFAFFESFNHKYYGKEDELKFGIIQYQMFGMSDAAQQIGDLNHTVADLTDVLESTSVPIMEGIAGINKFLEEIKKDGIPDSFTKKLTDMFSEKTSEWKSFAGKSFKVISLITLLTCTSHFVVTREDRSKKLTYASVALFGIAFADKVPEMVSFITKYLSKSKQEPEHQSSTNVITSIIVGAAAIVLGTSNITGLKKYFTTVVCFEKFSQGMLSIFEHLSKIFIGLLEWTGLIEYIPTSVRYIFERNDDIKKIANKAQEIHSECYKGDFCPTLANQERVDVLLQEMKEIRWNSPKLNSSALNYEINFFSKLAETIASSGYDISGSRPEPACLMMGGKPGQLKSAFMRVFCSIIARDYFTDEQKRLYEESNGNVIYNRVHETKYWDGYTRNHRITTFDEFGQAVDIAGTPDNEVLNLYRCINTRPYMLHVAELQNKGKTYFNSDFVIATTNRQNFNFNSVISADGLIRRMHVKVWVELKPEFGIWVEKDKRYRLDVHKMPKKDGNTVVTKDMVDFYEWFPNSTDSQWKGRKLTFDQVYAMLKATHQQHHEIFESQQNVVDEVLNENVEDLVEDEELLGMMNVLALEDTTPETTLQHNIPTKISAILERLKEKYRENFNKVMSECKNHYFTVFCRGITMTALAASLVSIEAKVFLAAMATGTVASRLLYRIGDGAVDCFIETQKLVTLRSSADFKNFFIEKYNILETYVGGLFAHLYEYAQHYGTIAGIAYLILGYGYGKGVDHSKKYVPPCTSLNCAGNINLHTKWIDFEMCAMFVPLGLHTCNIDWRGFTSRDSSQNIPLSIFHDIHGKIQFDISDTDFWKYMQENGIDIDDKLAKRFSQLYVQYQSRDQPRGRYQVQYQMAGDRQSELISESVMRGNSYELGWHIDRPSIVREMENINQTLLGHILFIRDRVLLICRHYIKGMERMIENNFLTMESTIILTKLDGSRRSIKRFMRVCDLLNAQRVLSNSLENSDIRCYRLDRSLINCHKDLVPLFVNRVKTDYFSGFLKNGGETILNLNCRYELNVTVAAGLDEYGYVNLQLHNLISYDCNNKVGHCGSVLFLSEPTSKAKILGLHVAGTSGYGRGFSAVVTRSTLEEILSSRDIIDNTISHQAFIPDSIIPFEFEQLCQAQYQMNYPNRTNIVRSKLYYDIEGPDQAPAILSKEAYELAVNRYVAPTVYFEPDELRMIVDSTFRSMNKFSKICKLSKRVTTWEETVYGIEGDPTFGMIDRSTSAGYPYVFQRGNDGGKTKWLNTGEDKYFTPAGEELLRHCEFLETELAQRKRCLFVYTDNLKDETVKKKKVLSKKTRLFSGCPIDYLILFRKYYGAFTKWIVDNRLYNGIAVGTNPYKEWHELAIMLLRHVDSKGYGCLAGDYSGFDANGKAAVYTVIGECINQWYDDSERNQTIREMLWLELAQSRHIHGNVIYEWIDSLPSGNPITSIVNSIYNLVLCRYSWYILHDRDRKCLELYDTEVYIITYGDDLNGSVSSSSRDKFDEILLTETMKIFGQKYTSDIKDTVSQRFRYFDEITFLKNNYLFDDVAGKYIAALSMDTIQNTPRWTNRKKSDDITIQNSQWYLRHLALWGPEHYRKYAPRFIEAFQRHFPGVPLVTEFIYNHRDVLSLDYVY